MGLFIIFGIVNVGQMQLHFDIVQCLECAVRYHARYLNTCHIGSNAGVLFGIVDHGLVPLHYLPIHCFVLATRDKASDVFFVMDPVPGLFAVPGFYSRTIH